MNALFQAMINYVVTLATTFGRGWNRFWFQPSDPTTLAAIRICTGMVLLYAYGTIVAEVPNLIGPHGWLDDRGVAEMKQLPAQERLDWLQRLGYVKGVPEHIRGELKQLSAQERLDWLQRMGYINEVPEHLRDQDPGQNFENFHLSVYDLVPGLAGMWIVYGIFLAGCLCMTLGFCSRIACIIAWIGHVSFVYRSQFTWFGMDSMLAFLTFYQVFGPSGAVLSVDRCLARWRQARAASASRGKAPADASPVPRWDATVVIRMIQVHMCIVYFAAGCAKLMGGTWWSGWATWLTMNVPEFRLIDVSWIGMLPDWMVEFIMGATTLATVIFEIGFPFLIYHRMLRPLMLFTAFMLHVGIGFFMGLGAFGCSMLTGLLAFVSPESVNWFIAIVTKPFDAANRSASASGSVVKQQGTHLKSANPTRSAP